MERLALCLKNLGRHGWRTRVILLITLFGAFLTFVSENLIEDVSRKQSDMLGRASLGHFRILAKDIETANTFGYYHYDSRDMLEPDEIASVKAYLATLPEVSGSLERIVFYGLFYGAGDKENGFSGVAMDMASCGHDFTDMYFARGQALQSGDANSCAASWYEYQQDKSLDVGAHYVFLLPNRDGEYVDRDLLIKGGVDFRTMPKGAYGLSGLYFDLKGFRSAVGYQRDLASEVVGFLTDARSSARVLPRVASFLAERHPRLKVVSWREYAPIMSEIVTGFDVMMKTVEAILLAICVLLVVKLTTFSIIERYSEIGTMRALGFTRADIALQFALEGTIIIAAGAAIGIALGAGLIAVLHATGVSNSMTFFEYVIGNFFRPSFHAGKIALVVGAFALVAAFAPLFPAIRGGRLSILTTLEKR